MAELSPTIARSWSRISWPGSLRFGFLSRSLIMFSSSKGHLCRRDHTLLSEAFPDRFVTNSIRLPRFGGRVPIAFRPRSSTDCRVLSEEVRRQQQAGRAGLGPRGN
jgi:hypothetical protein